MRNVASKYGSGLLIYVFELNKVFFIPSVLYVSHIEFVMCPVSPPSGQGHGPPQGLPQGATVFPLPGSFPWAHSSRGKPRRGMMRRAVFSDLQRKGLEKRFQLQKYISKPDRKRLADKLGLKDSQVSNLSDR